MKTRHLVAGALALACAAPAAAQLRPPAPTYEIGAMFGLDLRAEETLWALSIAQGYGNGFKGVIEYADGRHGGQGLRTVSLKGFQTLGTWAGIEFALGAGGAYASDARDSGWGLSIGAEAVYAFSLNWALKAEVNRLFAIGGTDAALPATVVQGGLLWRF